MTEDAELWARQQFQQFILKQRTLRRYQWKRRAMLFGSIFIFFVLLFLASFLQVQSKQNEYAPALPTSFASGMFWFAELVTIVTLCLTLYSLVDLIIFLIPESVEQYIALQVVRLTAFLHPSTHLGLCTGSNVIVTNENIAENGRIKDATQNTCTPITNRRPIRRMSRNYGSVLRSEASLEELGLLSDGTASISSEWDSNDLLLAPPSFIPIRALSVEDADIAHTKHLQSTMTHVVKVVLHGKGEYSCPVDSVPGAVAVIDAARSYIFDWIAARRYHQTIVLLHTLLPLGLVIFITLMIGAVMFLAILIGFLIPSGFQLQSLYNPAAFLLAYAGLYAVISSMYVAETTFRLLDQTQLQIRYLQMTMQLLHGRADVFAVAADVTEDGKYLAAWTSAQVFFKNIVRYMERYADDLVLWGIPVRYAYVQTVIGLVVTQVLTIVVTIVKSLSEVA